MYRVICKQCGANTLIPGGDPDVQLSCKCCPLDHHHGLAAGACPGSGVNHAGADCTHPAGGRVCNVVTPEGDPCPGGHCGLGVDGCTVCRPVTIEFVGANMGMVG